MKNKINFSLFIVLLSSFLLSASIFVKINYDINSFGEELSIYKKKSISLQYKGITFSQRELLVFSYGVYELQTNNKSMIKYGDDYVHWALYSSAKITNRKHFIP